MIKAALLKVAISLALNWLIGWIERSLAEDKAAGRVVVAEPATVSVATAETRRRVVVRHKVSVDTRPGTFNRSTGTWN